MQKRAPANLSGEPFIFRLYQIQKVLKTINLVEIVEQGFVSYSQGQVVVPPVGELLFNNPPGDVHIKYGYIKGDEYYVIKVASGFYENIKLGIAASSGLMLLFRQNTGHLAGILLDEGYLTNIRTAVAGAIAAKYLAPRHVNSIGVFGAGIQARLQVLYLKDYITCHDIRVWGLDRQECLEYKKDMTKEGYQVNIADHADDIGHYCNLIIMATPAKSPLLKLNQIRKGTHITAMGSDTAEKNELDPHILQETDIIVADSVEQCKTRGEIFQAVSAGFLQDKNFLELGNVISGNAAGRTSSDQITVADLTGVAVQDIQIAVAVFKALSSFKKDGKQ